MDIDIIIRVLWKFHTPKVYKYEENNHNRGAHASLVELLLPLLFLSWWWVFEMRSDHLETVWIPLEAERLNGWRTLSNDPYKCEFYSILDDRITKNRWWDHLLLELQLSWMFWFNTFCCNHYFGQRLGELFEPQIRAPSSKSDPWWPWWNHGGGPLTRLIHMVVECTWFSVKIKS